MPPHVFITAILNTLWLGVLFWIGAGWVRARGSGRLRVGTLAMLTVAWLPFVFIVSLFHFGTAYWAFITLFGENVFSVLKYSLVTVLIAASLFRPAPLARATYRLLLVLSPFVVSTFTRSALATVRALEQAAPRSHVVRARGDEIRQRVVVTVFDELDYQLLFGKRIPSLEVPAFDSLRSISIAARHAFSPNTATLLSFPSYWFGRTVDAYSPSEKGKFRVKFRDEKTPVDFRVKDTLLHQAREGGARVSIVGWYHPYCELFAEAADECFWLPVYENSWDFRDPLKLVALQFMTIGRVDPWSRKLFSSDTRYQWNHEATTKALIAESERAVSSKDINFVFLHLPIPHEPGIWNRYRRQYDTGPDANYLDNLSLADYALGRLRSAMENAGVLDETFWIVTSDHHWRRLDGKVGDYRTEEEKAAFLDQGEMSVPFLVKPAGAKEADGAAFDPDFNTILLHDLTLAALRGEVQSSSEVIDWLKSNRKRFPVDTSASRQRRDH